MASTYEGLRFWLLDTQGVYNSWNFIDAPGKFSCQLDNMPITQPNLVTSLNLKNCHLTIFVQFYSQCHT